MKYRTLGKTGLKVSEIGMGTWQQVGDENSWTKPNLEESEKSLSRYVELGGNFIDTASSYGSFTGQAPGEHPSEKFIGEFLKKNKISRDKVVITTKVHPKNWTWPAHKGSKIENVFPSDHITQVVDDSLKNLKLDYIDLVQFHVWQDEWARENIWKDTIQKIIQSGKVHYWGISINDFQPSNCLQTLETGLISTIQFIFNLFHQKPTEKLFPYALNNNIGLIVRVPMDEGGLTGKFTTHTTFLDGDFRKEYFSPEHLVELIERTDKLKKLLSTEAKNLVELNLRYILSFVAVSTVIPGMRKVKYVEENTSMSDDRGLTPKLLEQLKNYAWERNFYPESWRDPALKMTNYIET